MQKSFSDLEYAAKKKLTRRDRFLAEIDKVTPWWQLHQLIEPFYPKAVGAGRPPIGLARMLRMYVAQQCFGLSDEGIEDAIDDSQAIRGFVGIDLASTWHRIDCPPLIPEENFTPPKAPQGWKGFVGGPAHLQRLDVYLGSPDQLVWLGPKGGPAGKNWSSDLWLDLQKERTQTKMPITPCGLRVSTDSAGLDARQKAR